MESPFSRVVQTGRAIGPTSIIEYVVFSFGVFVLLIVFNIVWQFLPRRKSEPPTVFHWFPFIGNAISYGTDPCDFMIKNRKKYGDIYSFTMFGSKTTVYLGIAGNEFILNGKISDLNAEEIYAPLCTPVFGSGVVYDCPNAKFMEQKKFVKFGLTQTALESHVRLIEAEVLAYIKTSPSLKGPRGTVDVSTSMAQITIFTAGRTLQGAEVRSKLTNEFAKLYHDLDNGFQPINFLIPWAPLPQNRRRDRAHTKMRGIYMDIISARRARGARLEEEEPDMLWNLMGCVYKDGEPIGDKEIAHMMITLLLGGQHSSSSAGAWILLHLAARPDIADELFREQQGLGEELEYADIERMPLMQAVVKETLRLRSSIHSIMRMVKSPMSVPGTEFVIKPGRAVLASPAVTHLDGSYFANPYVWDPHRWDSRVETETEEDLVDYGYGAVSKGTRSPYLPFGGGRHRCIGEGFAYVNLCTIVATLVRNFRFSTLDGKPTLPPTDYTSLFSMPTRPAVIRWEGRFPKEG
ncbi:cytochrome P450 51A [Lasiosphaeria hispida]|uniref:Cytochrome P450 51A n=1 Tax=Lasiosphaeria hispida TaxID=260671 RepID=A0AAJ0MLC7_9PEZI|nr:cytochrome P450 51A [Lasiosphaeria hispida]